MNERLKTELKLWLAATGLQLGLPQNWVYLRLGLTTTQQWIAMQRAGVTKKLRRQIFRRDKGICYLCGRPIGGIFHLEHKLALANGGDNSPKNLGIAHPLCTLRKGKKML